MPIFFIVPAGQNHLTGQCTTVGPLVSNKRYVSISALTIKKVQPTCFSGLSHHALLYYSITPFFFKLINWRLLGSEDTEPTITVQV